MAEFPLFSLNALSLTLSKSTRPSPHKRTLYRNIACRSELPDQRPRKCKSRIATPQTRICSLF